jgi:hypothetical protein
MIKKHFASVFIAIVAILTFTACCIATCNADSICKSIDDEVIEMERVFNQKEAELDSLNQIMPLLDTVGETDTYCDLLEEREAFCYSRTLEKKREAYKTYLWLQSLVVEEAKEWIKEHKTQDN